MTIKEQVAAVLPPLSEILAGLKTLESSQKLSVERNFDSVEELLEWVAQNPREKTSDNCPFSKNRSFIDFHALISNYFDFSFTESIETVWKWVKEKSWTTFWCFNISRHVIERINRDRWGFFTFNEVDSTGWKACPDNHVLHYLAFLTLREENALPPNYQ